MKNVTLQVRIPKDTAISILGRLWGSGYLTRKQYEEKISQIDDCVLEREKKKAEKMDKIMQKILKK